jgi:hypothetical protein
MKTIIISSFIIISLFLLTSCTNKNDATRALESYGFSEIEFTGYRAKNINGKIVYGTVCSGLFFKNSTVRFK